MALKITLIAATGTIQLEKDALPAIIRPSQDLIFTLHNSNLQIHEKHGKSYVFLASEVSSDIQDSGAATLANDAAVIAYLAPIIGVQKTV